MTNRCPLGVALCVIAAYLAPVYAATAYFTEFLSPRADSHCTIPAVDKALVTDLLNGEDIAARIARFGPDIWGRAARNRGRVPGGARNSAER